LKSAHELQSAGRVERAELLLVCAAVNGHLSDPIADPVIQLLERLGRKDDKPFTDAEGLVLQNWRLGLDAKSTSRK
jgi:hypothetical protein